MSQNKIDESQFGNLTAGSRSCDAVTMEVVWNRLVAIMDEVDIALVRTAFSTIVGETRDFAVLLLDNQARGIVQSQLSSPAFTCSLPSATRHMLEQFKPEELAPGDVLLCNDPWICHGHLPDFYIVCPLFYEGALQGYIATAAHISDIGGRLDEFVARDVYEEGLRIPPSKLYEAYQPNKQLFDILRANIRYPELVFGDVDAIIGSARIGESRYASLLREYGSDLLEEVAEQILSRSEAAMRAAIAKIPNGNYRAEITCDGYKVPTHIKCSITVQADSVYVDYTGSSAQRSDASVNCVQNVAHAHTLFAFKASLVPDIPNNEGLYRPITTYSAPGTITNAIFPAPVKARSKTSYHLHNAIYLALSEVLPHAVQAGSGSFWSIKCYGRDASGQRAVIHALPNGGRGAVNGMDGTSTTGFPGNGTLTPIEIIENGIPVLVTERSLRVNSGGPGAFRGGLGQTIRLTPLGETRISMGVRSDKVNYPAPGIAGGYAGAPGEMLLDGKIAVLVDTFDLGPGQVLTLQIPGGGGYGDPTIRDPELVRLDLENGLITPDVAQHFYTNRKKAS